MRRGIIVLVVGASVLGLVIAVSVLFGVIIPRLRPDPGSRPSYAPGELTPAESTVVVKAQPDGTVRVLQQLTFDAGPGTRFPVTWYIGGTEVGGSADRSVRLSVVPNVLSVEAEETPPGEDSVPLDVTVDDSGYDDPFTDGRRYALSRPGPWSPGRHRVDVTFVLGDVWVERDGARMLVVPLRFMHAPDSGQPADLVRLTVDGALRLECPDGLEPFADRKRCGNGEQLDYRPDELRSQQAVTVPDPGSIPAAPIPITERAR